MSTESAIIRKATLVSEAARSMRDDPASSTRERQVMLQVLALDNTRLALLYDAVQYAREAQQAL